MHYHKQFVFGCLSLPKANNKSIISHCFFTPIEYGPISLSRVALFYNLETHSFRISGFVYSKIRKIEDLILNIIFEGDRCKM